MLSEIKRCNFITAVVLNVKRDGYYLDFRNIIASTFWIVIIIYVNEIREIQEKGGKVGESILR